MPIFAPLADTVGIPRFVIVTAYQFGQYAMLFLAPTGLIMATLQMLDMKYSHWFKFGQLSFCIYLWRWLISCPSISIFIIKAIEFQIFETQWLLLCIYLG